MGTVSALLVILADMQAGGEARVFPRSPASGGWRKLDPPWVLWGLTGAFTVCLSLC